MSFVGFPAKTIVSRAAAALYVAALAVAALWVIINGPALHDAAERHRADQIGQENTIYCEKFGMARGTDNFSRCAGYLDEIRRRQTDRLNADAIL
jgi:hypothetical protein